MLNVNINPKEYFWFYNFIPDIEIYGGEKFPIMINNLAIDSILRNLVFKGKGFDTIFKDIFNIIEFDTDENSTMKKFIRNNGSAYMLERTLPKGSIHDSMKNIINYNSVISDIINANIFFVEDKQRFIDCVNENYNAGIDDFFSVQIRLSNGKKYIFVETKKVQYNDIDDYRYVIMTQIIYNHRQGGTCMEHNKNILKKIEIFYHNKKYDFYQQ